MNRNLKRVLSVALMAVMLAVNFVIPAMAATTITVTYEALKDNTLTGKQGELFYETSPGTTQASTGLDTGSFYIEYAPLEVPSGGNANVKNALQMAASEWVRFTVNAPVAGYYAVNPTCARAQALDLIIRTDKTMIEKSFTRSTTMAAAGNIGYLYLEQGDNYVYVDNKSTAVFRLKSMTFTLDESVDASQVKLVAPVASATEIADLTVAFDDGYNQADVSGATLTFPVSIAAEGKYKVSVMGKATGSNTVSADFGEAAKEATVSNDAYGYTEIGVFPLTVPDAGSYTLTLDGFTDYSFAWAKIEYVGTYATAMTTESITDGDTVSRGTDSYVIEFNDNIDEVDAATQITLESADDTIATVASVVGKVLTVSFKETLDYSTPYTLTLTGLKGVYDDNAMADRVVTFTTADDSNTDGTATLEITSVDSSYEDGTVTGVVKGSTGVGIKGREVTVYDSTMSEVATGESGDDGAFEIDFTITEATAGAYTYTVDSEYGATASATVTYVNLAEEQRILGLFASATTPAQVAAIFENATNAEILQVPGYPTDVATFANADRFHNHFIGQTFTRVQDLAPFYEKVFLLETLNQSVSTLTINPILKTAEKLNKVGFSEAVMNKLALLSNTDKEDLASDLVTKNQSVVSENAAAFYQKFTTVLDAWLLGENNITATTLSIAGATTTTNYAGEIAIPVVFAAEQTQVASIDFTVQVTSDGDMDAANDGEILANAEAVLKSSPSSTVTIVDDTATFTVVYDEAFIQDAVHQDLGRLSLQASKTGTFSFDVNATVYYRIQNGDDFVDMPITVTGGTFTCTVGNTPAPQERPSTGGAGGGGYVAPPKEPEKEDEEDDNPVYFFDDMADALWAQDMVHTLVGKGVISKNDERAFRPMDNVTREEFVKMIITVIGSHDEAAVSTLADVNAGHWATSYIATAQKLGIVQGNADGTFGVGTNITRQDMAVMIFRTFEVLGIDLTAGDAAFGDSNEISNYAKDAVSALTKLGIINGMGDNTFAPAANATRAQSAKVIYVMMEVLGV